MSTFTESEAAGRWCPFARCWESDHDDAGTYVAAATNRNDNGKAPTQARCIGSKCMAWRWDERTSKADAQALGFCGLVPIPPGIDG